MAIGKKLVKALMPKKKPSATDSKSLERSSKRKPVSSEQRSAEDARNKGEDEARKNIAKEAKDLGTPAGAPDMQALRGQSDSTDKASKPRIERAGMSNRSKGISKEYKATEKRLEKLQTDLKQAKTFLKAASNNQQKKTFSSKVSEITEKVQIQKNKLADMGKKNLIRRKGGGYMKKKMSVGGPLKMVEKNGKKVPFYAADGIGKMSEGGGVSKAMGEDRTSVPKSLSAKAQSKKPVKKKMGGGKVYKRKMGGKTVSGNDGNSIVAACYD